MMRRITVTTKIDPSFPYGTDLTSGDETRGGAPASDSCQRRFRNTVACFPYLCAERTVVCLICLALPDTGLNDSEPDQRDDSVVPDCKLRCILSVGWSSKPAEEDQQNQAPVQQTIFSMPNSSFPTKASVLQLLSPNSSHNFICQTKLLASQRPKRFICLTLTIAVESSQPVAPLVNKKATYRS